MFLIVTFNSRVLLPSRLFLPLEHVAIEVGDQEDDGVEEERSDGPGQMSASSVQPVRFTGFYQKAAHPGSEQSHS